MSKKTTIADISSLGYAVGVAHGSVEREVEDHATAVAAGDPNTLAEKASETALSIVREAMAGGAEPKAGKTWEEVAQEITAQAFRMLTEGTQSRIEMHERAIGVASASPTVYHVSGPGITTYVEIDDATGKGWTDDAQELLDALANPAVTSEREFQVNAPPEVVDAVLRLRGEGIDVVAAAVGDDSFSVKVEGAKAATTEESVAALVDRFVPADLGQE